MGSVAEGNDDNKGNIQWTWNRHVEIIQSEEQSQKKIGGWGTKSLAPVGQYPSSNFVSLKSQEREKIDWCYTHTHTQNIWNNRWTLKFNEDINIQIEEVLRPITG